MIKSKFTLTLLVLYALLILVGGLIGFLKAGSLPSLVASVVFSPLLLASAWGIQQGRKGGVYGAVFLVLILDSFFTYRYLSSLVFMPSGLMSLSSLLVLISLGLSVRKLK